MWRFLKALTAPANGSTADSGTVVDLPAHLQRLLAAPSSAFLIVEVSGVEDGFLQFTAGGGVIQLDYPLITDAQTGREHALRAACDAVGHPAREAHGSDGSRTLNSDLPADPSPAAAAIERILQMVFGVGSRTELKFIGEGLAPTARRQSG